MLNYLVKSHYLKVQFNYIYILVEFLPSGVYLNQFEFFDLSLKAPITAWQPNHLNIVFFKNKCKLTEFK